MANKYEDEFEIMQYRCTLCGRCVPCVQGEQPVCPHCGAERKAYIEIKHDAGKDK